MKSQATRVTTNIPTEADSAYAVGIRPASQPEADADTVPARARYSNLVSVTVASAIIVVGGIVMAYAGLGLAMWPG